MDLTGATWGSRPQEVARTYACDAAGDDLPVRLVRAVGVDAPAATAFAWLCQLRDAPYSYDLVDNRGRRSPRTRTVQVEDLTPGTRMMEIFTLEQVVPGEHLTMRITEPRAVRFFGPVTVTYAAFDDGPDRSRIVAVLRVGARRPGRATGARRLLAWGDLVMMRKQLLTLARLAGREAAAVSGSGRR